MIELTNENGKKVTISADHITIVTELTDSGCFVSTVDSGLTVKESRKEVVRKIMEYKEATAKFGSLTSVWASVTDTESEAFKAIDFVMDNLERHLKRLAGLDGDPDSQT